jgi:hypothetical protein
MNSHDSSIDGRPLDVFLGHAVAGLGAAISSSQMLVNDRLAPFNLVLEARP